MTEVSDPVKAEALERLAAGIDAVALAGVSPHDAAEARALIAGLEAQARRLRSVQVDLVDEIDRTGAHRFDGHASAKVMVRHVAKLSNAEAARRAQSARALRDLPTVRTAFRAGRIGGCQVERIARAHANLRVRAALIANDTSFAAQAERVGYRDFDVMVGDWVRLVDEDGTRDTNQRNHNNRDAKILQGYDGSWEFSGGCGSLHGAELEAIFKAFLQAETLTDWDKARATHGDAATAADLPRTEGQRRFDALFEIFQRAATHHTTTGGGGSQLVTNVVIDHATFERVAATLAGDQPTPLAQALSPFPTRTYRCSTIDGRPVEAAEAVARALTGHIRRVVVGAEGVVIDLSRRRRLFTGAAQLAVRLSATECYWPGCHVPVSDCQTDHLTPWGDRRGDAGGGGCTNPGNGGPACGKHNRHKEHGYTAHRDQAGTWHVTRPDGTPID